MRRTRETGQNELREKRQKIREKCDYFLSSYVEGSQQAYTSFVKLLQEENFWLEDQKVCSHIEGQDQIQQKQHEKEPDQQGTSKQAKRVRFAFDEEDGLQSDEINPSNDKTEPH